MDLPNCAIHPNRLGGDAVQDLAHSSGVFAVIRRGAFMARSYTFAKVHARPYTRTDLPRSFADVRQEPPGQRSGCLTGPMIDSTGAGEIDLVAQTGPVDVDIPDVGGIVEASEGFPVIGVDLTRDDEIDDDETWVDISVVICDAPNRG